MTRFCPVCGTENDVSAVICECGRVTSEDLRASDIPQTFDPSRYKRKLVLKKGGALVGAGTIVLLFAAYFGGFFPMQGRAETEEELGPAALDISAPVAQRAAPAFPESNFQHRSFPEANVTYMATRAITGAIIAVRDTDGQERRITLFGIQAPKLDQSFGIESKENLWMLIADKPLMIKRRKFTKEVDTIAEVFVDGSNAGLEHLRAGMALLEPYEVTGLPGAEHQLYMAAALSAKQGKHGIWSGKTLNAAQRAQTLSQTARTSPPVAAGVRRQGQETKSTGSIFDLPEYVYEPVPSSSAVAEPVKPKEQKPAVEVPSAEPSREPVKVVVTQPATGRKYTRGPFGGCYYLNSNGNKTYVDRSKCEGT